MSETMNNVRHNKYDHVFRIVFSKPEELLSLYNALSGKHYSNPDELIINTLQDAVFIGMKNDVSFIIENYQNLYEHQSTKNPNMPLRGLFYFSDLYKVMYPPQMLYRSSLVEILTPQYIVFYNGAANVPDRYDMHLSDAFINKTDQPDLEVIAHVININLGHNKELLESCQKLKEYAILTQRMQMTLTHKNREHHRELALQIIEQCINEGILADILSKERDRIMDSYLSHFDLDEYGDVMKEEGYEDGYEDGYEAAKADLEATIAAKDTALASLQKELQELRERLK